MRCTLRLTAPSNTPELASTRLNQRLARVMAMYSSSLVNTGVSASGNTKAVWLNSDGSRLQGPQAMLYLRLDFIPPITFFPPLLGVRQILR